MRRIATLALVAVSACSDTSSPVADTGDSGGDDGPATTTGPPSSDGVAPTTTTADDDGASTNPADVSGSDGTGPVGGCGVDPGFTGAIVGTITVDDVERRFVLVVPDDYDPDVAYPIVYMWHGRGSNGEQLRLYAGVEEAAAGAAIFVYPDGLPLASMGNATGWELEESGRDIALFDALHADLDANLCIDPERVFASGHSFGGFFSNSLGCLRGDVLRAIGPVAGGGPGAACTGEVAAFVVHGEADPVVPTLLGEGSRDYWVMANGCSTETMPVDPEPCVAYTGCSEGLGVTWCLHAEEGLGLGTHTWPTFAGAAIWDFFAQ